MANQWNWKALAIAVGTFVGGYVFLASIFAMNNVEFWWFNNTMWEILSNTFPITASISGAFIGLIVGFLCGAVCGAIIAWLYNVANKIWK